MSTEAQKRAARNWQIKNSEKNRENHRKYYEKNRDNFLKNSSEDYYRRMQENPLKERENRRNWKKTNPEKVYKTNRNSYLKRTYGITLEEHNELLAKQNGCCAICGSDNPQSKTGWHLDHDHTTGKVRGILCQPCNHMLGGAKDKKEILEAAIKYLN